MKTVLAAAALGLLALTPAMAQDWRGVRPGERPLVRQIEPDYRGSRNRGPRYDRYVEECRVVNVRRRLPNGDVVIRRTRRCG